MLYKKTNMKRFIALTGILGTTMLFSSLLMAMAGTLLKLPCEGTYPATMIGLILSGSAASVVAIIAFMIREAIKDIRSKA